MVAKIEVKILCVVLENFHTSPTFIFFLLWTPPNTIQKLQFSFALSSKKIRSKFEQLPPLKVLQDLSYGGYG